MFSFFANRTRINFLPLNNQLKLTYNLIDNCLISIWTRFCANQIHSQYELLTEYPLLMFSIWQTQVCDEIIAIKIQNTPTKACCVLFPWIIFDNKKEKAHVISKVTHFSLLSLFLVVHTAFSMNKNTHLYLTSGNNPNRSFITRCRVNSPFLDDFKF